MGGLLVQESLRLIEIPEYFDRVPLCRQVVVHLARTDDGRPVLPSYTIAGAEGGTAMARSSPLASRVLRCTTFVTLLLVLPMLTGAQADLASRVDVIMAPFASDAPGASVVVVKDGRVLVRRAYGLDNLETRTPMRPEMVFELGSVTKQFTSTAILLLAQQGKLSLDDDVRKYVPDFPDKRARITVN